ncbi:MAG: NAD(P)/FAD-dependent oxidoreductase [Sphingobacteriales bacterium]|nr:MAG: NAD(P)/FAD-dependent oxidoreductase [Sphingobacteriales bacterium]
MNKPEKVWDVIIVGAGPAGTSAAMVLARSRRSVLLIDEGKQRNLKSHGLHNFITRDGILPPDFLNLAHSDLKQYPITYRQGKITDVKKAGNSKSFLLTEDKGKTFLTRRILLATGVSDFIPDIPGMEELWGQYVFHCPFCDGYECKEKKIGLYAAKHNGYAMALALRHLSDQVFLFTHGNHYLKPVQKSFLAKKNIQVFTRKIRELKAEKGKLVSVLLSDDREIPCDFMFTHNGFEVNSHLASRLGCKCTKKGAAITNRHQETNIPGLYVAGDASIDMHFVVVAAAEGVKAAVAIHNDLLETENKEALKVKDS